MTRLYDLYKDKIAADLQKEFGYKNVMETPRLEKVVLNMGVGQAVQDKKFVQQAEEELDKIAGQKSVVTKAKKSIAGFKLREGMPLGCKVTLRKQRMYEFIDRLATIALPRVRDFRGVKGTGFDGNGNFTMGLKEQIVFPEIDYDKVDNTKGLDITFVTTAKTDEEAFALLKGFNIPFNGEPKKKKQAA